MQPGKIMTQRAQCASCGKILSTVSNGEIRLSGITLPAIFSPLRAVSTIRSPSSNKDTFDDGADNQAFRCKWCSRLASNNKTSVTCVQNGKANAHRDTMAALCIAMSASAR